MGANWSHKEWSSAWLEGKCLAAQTRQLAQPLRQQDGHHRHTRSNSSQLGAARRSVPHIVADVDVVAIVAIFAWIGRYCSVPLLFLPLELQTLCLRQFALSGNGVGRVDHFQLVVVLATVVQGVVVPLVQEACTLLAPLCLRTVCFCHFASGRREATTSTFPKRRARVGFCCTMSGLAALVRSACGYASAA